MGKVVQAPIGREMTPGNVWVQWRDEMDKSYPYRVGFSGKMDLKIAKAGIGGHYLLSLRLSTVFSVYKCTKYIRRER
jgi:hypothetical protein